jgi:transketolase
MTDILKPCDVDLRDAFFDELCAIAAEDRNVILLTDDQGAFALDKFKRDMPDQYINAGIAEQNIVAVAAGLAMGGKIPFVYGISTFIIMRCFEQIRVDLCCMNLPVAIMGSGPGYTYGSDGPTHHATQDVALLRTLPEMTILNPTDAVSSSSFARIAYKDPGPKYVRLEKGVLPGLYEAGHDFSRGFEVLMPGCAVMIVATGIMTHCAIKVAEALGRQGVEAGVLDLYRVKPVRDDALLAALSHSRRVVTVEENSIVGGVGSLIAEVLADLSQQMPLKRFALPDEHSYLYGSRDWLLARQGLGVDPLTDRILRWLEAARP